MDGNRNGTPGGQRPPRTIEYWLTWWLLVFVIMVIPFLEFGPFVIVFPFPACLAAISIFYLRFIWNGASSTFIKVLATMVIPALTGGLGWLAVAVILKGTHVLFL